MSSEYIIVVVTHDTDLANVLQGWLPEYDLVTHPPAENEVAVDVPLGALLVLIDEDVVLYRWWEDYLRYQASAVALLVKDESSAIEQIQNNVEICLIKSQPPALFKHNVEQMLQLVLARREMELVATNLDVIQMQTEEIIRKEKELRRLKDRFMVMASHEFRTPLTVIASASEMLDTFADSLNPEERQKYVINIRERVQHLKNVMVEIERMIHTDFQTLNLDLQMADMGVLCQQVVQEFRLNERVRHEIELEIKGNKCQLEIDENKIHLVISALLSNAIKFSSPRFPVRVEVDCSNGKAEIRVIDRGIGIPEQDLPYIYDLFFQGSNIGAIGGKGRGMGLKIAHEYVVAHQGEIRVNTEEGQGSIFTVILPTERVGGRVK